MNDPFFRTAARKSVLFVALLSLVGRSDLPTKTLQSRMPAPALDFQLQALSARGSSFRHGLMNRAAVWTDRWARRNHLRDGAVLAQAIEIRNFFWHFSLENVEQALEENLTLSRELIGEFARDSGLSIQQIYDDPVRRAELYNRLPIAYDFQKELKTGKIHAFKRGIFVVLYNAMRSARPNSAAGSVQQIKPFEPIPAHFPGKIPFLGVVSSENGEYDLVGNKFPFAPDHWQAVSPTPRPQFLLLPDIRQAFQFLAAGKDALKIIFNGRGASSTINNFHFQAFTVEGVVEAQSLERAPGLPAESFIGDVQAVLDQVTVRRERQGAHGWPGRFVVFSSANADQLSTALGAFVDMLQSGGHPHNVLFSRSTSASGVPEFRAFVFLRSTKGEMPKGIPVRFATGEMAGYLVTPDETLARNVSADAIASALDQMSMPGWQIDELVLRLEERLGWEKRSTWKKITRQLERNAFLLNLYYQYRYPDYLFGLNGDAADVRKATARSLLRTQRFAQLRDLYHGIPPMLSTDEATRVYGRLALDKHISRTVSTLLAKAA